MAETLPNGTVIPQGSDLIHASGVQAMRNLGSSVDSQLANRALLGHTHPVSQVDGLADRLAALEEPQVTQISTGIYGVGERYTTPISTGIYQIGA